MHYEPQDFKHLLGMPGMSDALLTNHFTLYEGYVKNVNAIGERAQTIEPGTPESAELRRRFGWEWNGMRLHELYFGNMRNGELGMKNEELGRVELRSTDNQQTSKPANQITITLDDTATEKTIERLAEILKSFPQGTSRIFIRLRGKTIETSFSIEPKPESIEMLKNNFQIETR